jgi:hypothetical protein
MPLPSYKDRAVRGSCAGLPKAEANAGHPDHLRARGNGSLYLFDSMLRQKRKNGFDGG